MNKLSFCQPWRQVANSYSDKRCLWREHSSGEEYYQEDRLSEHQIRGWIAVSAEGLQGQGSPTISKGVLFSQTGTTNAIH